MSIRVLIADDQELLRATFRLLLDSTPDIEVVGEAANGHEAVARSSRGVDVVLMDIRMPDMDGIEATRRITSDPRLADVHVLILTTFETDELVVSALQAGASGFVGKGIRPPDLLQAIRTIAAGETLLSSVATTALIQRVVGRQQRGRQNATALASLTGRELEITTLVGQGLSNTAIARRLFISTTTAKTHVNRAMVKIGAHDRAQLVIFAYENHLVS